MKRRYKLLIGFLITSVFLIAIFLITKDRKIYYISLGDSLAIGQTPYNTIGKSYGDYVSEYLKDKGVLEFYTKDFSKSGYRSIDILNDLKGNKEINIKGKRLSLKHALIKADLVTLSIGANDLFYKLNIGKEFDLNDFDDIYLYIDESMSDIDKLLFELRRTCKEEIMVFGFYNPFIRYSSTLANEVEPVIIYANNKMQELTNKYNMTYLDMHDTFLANEEYLPKTFEIHPLDLGYRKMAKIIIDSMNEKMLAK